MDESKKARGEEFKQAMLADGWAVGPRGLLNREGFVAMVGTSGWVCLWGPDEAAVRVPERYSFEAIKRGLRICGGCGAEDVETVRFAFADRYCKRCAETTELPRGWAE